MGWWQEQWNNQTSSSPWILSYAILYSRFPFYSAPVRCIDPDGPADLSPNCPHPANMSTTSHQLQSSKHLHILYLSSNISSLALLSTEDMKCITYNMHLYCMTSWKWSAISSALRVCLAEAYHGNAWSKGWNNRQLNMFQTQSFSAAPVIALRGGAGSLCSLAETTCLN